jgi:lysophospholipase L1-like esterase
VRTLVGTVLGIALAIVGILAQANRPADEHWVGTWATAVVARPQTPPAPPAATGPPPFQANRCPPAPPPRATFIQFDNQTIRQIVHTSLGGPRLRVVLSNAYGTDPLMIGAAHVALREADAAIQAGSDRALTFGGRPTVTIPTAAVVYSDAVNLTVPDTADVAIDVYLPGSTNVPSPLTMHNGAFQTNYISATGNVVGTANWPGATTIQNWFLLTQVQVAALTPAVGVVAFGDSITDGTRSTSDRNSRWPDQLARRLLARGIRAGVMNAGIAGNRLLNQGNFGAGVNALARFDRDVLDQPGATHVIVLEGINDIGVARQNPAPTAEDLMAAHRQLIDRAHARGLKIYGATLTPFYGAAYYTDFGEQKREMLNDWIRTSGAYDAVIDFDKATRDPAQPRRLLAAYDSCDHLHPNDAGYKAMADAIDLSLFDPGGSASGAKR